MASYYFIGGHDFDCKSNYIQKKLLSLTNKNKPRILLFPTASRDSEKSIENFKKEYENLTYELDIVYLYQKPNASEIINKLRNYDILYFTGGNTFELVKFLKENNYDKILFEASKLDLIIAGVSAGAMVFTKFGLGDAYAYCDNENYYNYKKVYGLDIVNIGLCPHFNLGDRMLYFKDMISDIETCIGLDEDSAIFINENNINYFRGLSKSNIYVFKKENDYKMELVEKEKLSVLGPKGTFSDLAAIKYQDIINKEFKLDFYPSILKTANSINVNKIGILPFENSLDGYVSETLDSLKNNNFKIIGDLSIGINFAFISKNSNIKNVKKVFVQFKAKGQCLDFINEHDFSLIETESNTISYENFKNTGDTYGAIVPIHLVDRNFSTIVKNVEDSSENFTRFVIVKEDNNYIFGTKKGSLIINIKKDRPGILTDVLNVFKLYDINLTSIMSRPTKEALGKHYFFIEFELDNQISNFENLINTFKSNDEIEVQILGIYNTLEGEK